MTLEARTRALLDLVEQDRRERVARVQAEAEARARDTLARAHAQALTRVRQAFDEERVRRRERLAAENAQLRTGRRLAAQRRAAALLERAWDELPRELLARWRDPRARAEWVDRALDQARQVLPAGRWRIEFAAGWTDAERSEARRRLAALGVEAQCESAAGASAGLRVRAGGNSLDLTLEALMTERDRIASRLLRLVEEPQ